jgi:translation elongation factor EF-G
MMEKYLNGTELSEQELLSTIRKATQSGKFYPVLGGDNRGIIVQMMLDDVAKALDVPIGTVRSRLARGRRQLQAALYRHAVDAGLVEAQR